MVLKGARQVGKTWLMKEFGQSNYDNYVYFNFDEEDELKSIFETNKNPHRIIELLAMIAGEKIEELFHNRLSEALKKQISGLTKRRCSFKMDADKRRKRLVVQEYFQRETGWCEVLSSMGEPAPELLQETAA